ncbi:MAG: hypothetical protein RQ751_03800 [Longimicrobiales bacterium]|nr:hypothetical protein [Longimicrobiales bacterium]
MGNGTHVEEFVRVDGAQVVGSQRGYGQRGSLASHEFDLDGVWGMDMHHSSHVSFH